ncbi:p12 [Oxyplax ochracea nucleopolyhedrovirus]|uniref:p12 n=1 Tax=Oxyplax ochracea nucleopolyhedrovirus TaxID=2083176 RepID=A0A2L0WU17_9ABAC|nr:p12 [Oxyplax ochracea nucleopolyhedrovirus]AVA31140.1 p12 [Oxyplax ochracea nucleopolyhedrovirus]
MIASINDDDDVINVNRPRRSRRNVDDLNEAATNVLQNINISETAASLLINDKTTNKTNSLKILGSQSIAARNLLEPLQANASFVKLNRIETIDVLNFLGDVYDNTIKIVTAT